MLPLPSQVDRFVRLPGPAIRFLPLEELIEIFLQRLFPGYEVTGRGFFRLIRDSDVEINEEAEDLVLLYESALKRRRRGDLISIAFGSDMPGDLRDFLFDQLEIAAEHHDRQLLELALLLLVVGHERVHPLEHVLLVDRRVDLEAARGRDLDDVHLLGNGRWTVAPHLAELPPPGGLRVGTGHLGRLQEAMGVHPEFDGVDLGDVRFVGRGRAGGQGQPLNAHPLER